MTTNNQWEYSRVLMSRNPVGNYTVGEMSANLAPNPDIRVGIALDALLTILGNEGWDMVSVLGSEDKAHLLFKRLK